MNDDSRLALDRALVASRELLAAATLGDFQAVERLDAERFRLLQSLKPKRDQLSGDDEIVLKEISLLNDQALGLVEHLRRGMERALDMAAVGRRAVAAYSDTRPQR